MSRIGWALLPLVWLVGCSTSRVSVRAQPLSPQDWCRTGNYHAAMRALPEEMERWARHEEQTGETAEGAGGYAYAFTLSQIAERGEADWGKIFDDPEIPHAYKASLLFEIAEARLGKGSAWMPWHTPVIVIPRNGAAGSWAEVNELLKQALREREP